MVSTYRPTFNGCWAKIQRAKEHRDTLDRLVQELDREPSNWASVGLRYDAKGDEYILYVTHAPDLSEPLEQASLILGDAVHNLRCALDHAAFELAMWNTSGKPRYPRSVMFPIVGGLAYSEPPEKLWADAVKRWMRDIHPNHRAVIKSLQAHKRPPPDPPSVPHPLLLLRDLDDTDKHRLLNVMMLAGSNLRNPEPIALTIALTQHVTPEPYVFTPVRIEFGAEIFHAPIDFGPDTQHIDMDMVAYVAPEIALEQGWEVIMTLDWLGASVMKTITKFLLLSLH
jgi:hypothetical protein